MNQVFQFVSDHAFAILAIVSAIASCLPPPLPNERWYGFIYNVAHLSAINVGKVIPQLRFERKEP